MHRFVPSTSLSIKPQNASLQEKKEPSHDDLLRMCNVIMDTIMMMRDKEEKPFEKKKKNDPTWLCADEKEKNLTVSKYFGQNQRAVYIETIEDIFFLRTIQFVFVN